MACSWWISNLVNGIDEMNEVNVIDECEERGSLFYNPRSYADLAVRGKSTLTTYVL